MERFHIDVPQPVLDDLQRRLGDVRWPDALADDMDPNRIALLGHRDRGLGGPALLRDGAPRPHELLADDLIAFFDSPAVSG
jgi:predicted dienelactone hydrolase